MKLASWLLAAALALPAMAVAAAEPQPAPAKLALKAQRVLDVRTGKPLAVGLVLVEGRTIKAVGAHGVPAGYTLIDLGAATLLPGLIDAHQHLLASAGTGEYARMLLTQSQAARALAGAAHARKTLRAGFTTVRDVCNEGSGYADVALRDAIKRGLVEGPRMLVATRGIAIVGQYFPFGISPDLPDFPRGAQMVSGADEARRAVREQIGQGADLIKLFADWHHPTMTREELRVIVEEAHQAGIRVAAHATTPAGIRNAVEAGVDSIEHGFAPDRATLELMKKRGVWLVPTLAVLEDLLATAQEPARAELEKYLRDTRDTVKLARKVGTKIALGSDAAETAAHGRNARELLALRNAGLTSLEALQAATINAAELLKLQDEIGAIEAGRQADLIAVPGDPLADLAVMESVSFVMKAGVVVRRD